MSIRIRKDGTILCAAMHKEEIGDLYIDDPTHYELSVILGLLVSEPMEKHKIDGLWWWCNEIPINRTPDQFYYNVRNGFV